MLGAKRKLRRYLTVLSPPPLFTPLHVTVPHRRWRTLEAVAASRGGLHGLVAAPAQNDTGTYDRSKQTRRQQQEQQQREEEQDQKALRDQR